jgi:hypothetical protein
MSEESQDRHLSVPADDVPTAISVLREQMKREGERLTRIIAVGPESLLK